MPSGEEIQASLRALADTWRGYDGTERAEAQTFLNELLACYGADRRQVGAEFEYHRSGAGFMDLHWPEVCIVEMKAPSRAARLSDHYQQVFDYWQSSADPASDRPAARYVVLCAFHRFEIWEPGRFPRQPRAAFTLDELPDRYEALAFLSGPTVEASFLAHHRALTTEAAATVSRLFESLTDRTAAPIDEVQRFVLQCVWTMFAEDLGMLAGYPLQTIVSGLRRDTSRSSSAELGQLFRVLNQKGAHNRLGSLAGTRYVNGDLFARPAEVHLNPDELAMLAGSCEFDWRQVDPTIFGSLMEGVLGRSRRWELGAHYTHEVDIMKIVGPTIVRPWRSRIAALDTPEQGLDLLERICSFKVLDPACGCGNFLYVAYRELRALEHELKERIRHLASSTGRPLPPGPWPYYRLSNLQGLDIENVAVLIARVTLWMGHRQMIEVYGEAEHPLPLVDLSSIRRADALRDPWPETDCIIGNPPFLGSQWIRGAYGDEYVDWLSRRFHAGIKDYCVYWFRRAADHLLPGQRAGFVATNSVSQNRARTASLDYVVAQGGVLTDAISSQKWPGEAKVHVSIVNWVASPATPPDAFTLDGVTVDGLGNDLRPAGTDDWQPAKLAANGGRCFQGPIPVGAGFVLTSEEAEGLLARGEARYQDVVRPYLTGEDIAQAVDQGPRRWIIDFAQRPLQEAATYPAALAIVRERVKPTRQENNRELYRRNWWQFGEPRPGLRAASQGLDRLIAGNRVGKRWLVAWVSPEILPSDATVSFALDRDEAMGVLLSSTHEAWAWHRSSTLKRDLRYTPTSVFSSFPWPCPPDPAVWIPLAESARQLASRREQICADQQIGLTRLYNQVDEGAWQDLRDLHLTVDRAVVGCYGWPRAVAQDAPELVRRLTALNQQIAQGERRYSPFEA